MSKQLQLPFDALARRTDPDTSHVAALTVDANRLEGLVVALLERHPDGLIVKEIASLLDVAQVSISPHMKPLEKKELVRRTTIRRERSIVWKSTEE